MSTTRASEANAPIYLDHSATTALRPEVRELLYGGQESGNVLGVGNASSLHSFGRSARRRVEESRETIAALVGSAPSEVIFTASGTESNNLAIKGFYWRAVEENPVRKVIVLAAFEHHAVLEPAEWLVEHDGAELILAPILESGLVDLAALAEIVESNRERIALIAIMHSNNEVGSIQPIAEVVEIAAGIPVHSDAVQSFTKVDFNFLELGLTSTTISSHKIGGPLGVAALILERGIDVVPVLHGGGQERDLRSGTLNTDGIEAFALAAKIASESLEDSARVRALAAILESEIIATIPDVVRNGSAAEKLPGVVNLRFANTESDSLLLALDSAGVAASTGSACSAGVQRASHVLIAMGLSEDQARESIRFSLGYTTTEDEIRAAIPRIAIAVESARRAFSVGTGAKR